MLSLKSSFKRSHGDFETRSICDLKKYGLDIYSRHPSTDAWGLSWAFDDEPIEDWENDFNGNRTPGLLRLFDYIQQGGLFVAHNAPFEFAIWNNCLHKKYGWPIIKISQMECTMARAYSMSLPPALANLAPALGVPSHKDMDGHKLMMKMARPRHINDDGSITWWDAEDLRKRLITYRRQDVHVERECDHRLVPLSPKERLVWLMDQRINYRGIGVDRPAIEATRPIIEEATRKLNYKLRDMTDGAIHNVTQASKILQWCNDNGCDIESLRKNEMNDWLGMQDLSPEVRAVLELRADGAKTSVSKLETMMTMSMWDGRLHNMFQYYGANTGRWAARAVQLHNMYRPDKAFEDPLVQDEIISAITKGELDAEFIEMWHGPVMRVLASCVRGYLIARDDHVYIGADLVNIEGVVLSWLANEKWKLQAFFDFFAGRGHDLYLLSAGRIYGVEPDQAKPHRQIGKVSELALGYGGGKGAFQSMAVNYGVKVADDQAEDIKAMWRKANPAIVQFWAALEYAAKAAIETPGRLVKADRYYNWELKRVIELDIPAERLIAFRVSGSFLWCRLPSGRVLCYPYPEIQNVMKPWGSELPSVTFMGVDGRQKSKTFNKWVRLSTYGGSLAENVTQAVARDVLVDGMLELDKRKYPIVLHVHDEAVAECQKDFGSIDEVEQVMVSSSPWAAGMPLKAKGFMGKRYRK